MGNCDRCSTWTCTSLVRAAGNDARSCLWHCPWSCVWLLLITHCRRVQDFIIKGTVKSPLRLLHNCTMRTKQAFPLQLNYFDFKSLNQTHQTLSIVNTCSQDNMFSYRLAGEYTCFHLLAYRRSKSHTTVFKSRLRVCLFSILSMAGPDICLN